MKKRLLLSGAVATAAMLGIGATALGAGFKLKDPKGDDNGPGVYTYPTNTAYTPGGFDITAVSVKEKGDNIEFKVSVLTPITDPWDSKAWSGNGFSIQYVQIYLDLDHVAGSGVTKALPGMNVNFPAESAWDKVILISPQPTGRVQSEIDQKAAELKDRIIIPATTRPVGNALIAVIPKSAIGGGLPQGMGLQVLMQSNEGFCAATDLLTRKVNEYNGDHRFGGGSDYDCDPHVIDLIAGSAAGKPEEIEAQHMALKAYTCDEDETKWVWAVVPMVYPTLK